jgi:hypothetical protein
MKPGSNSVEDHPQLSHNRHPVDGSLWPLHKAWFTGEYEHFNGLSEPAPMIASVPVWMEGNSSIDFGLANHL